MKTIKHTKTVYYKESFIPKGCRKPRYQLVANEVTFKVKQVEKEDTEVAFIVHAFEHDPREIRLYNGKLYAQQQFVTESHENDGIRVRYIATPYKEDAVFLLCPRWDYSCSDTSMYNTPEDVEELQSRLDDTLIIGNEVYVRCYQPFYSWHSFGVNHSWCFAVEIPTTSYENYELRGIAPDDMDALREKYEEMNHTSVRYDSFEDSIKHEYIEVLMPECCKRKFRPAIYEGNKWYDGLQEQLRNDVLKFMERKKKEYAKEFRYLSNSDFASQFKDAATSASSIMAERIA